jgi:restriction system protein
MAIPDYQTLMLPLLKCFSDKTEKTLHQVSIVLAKEFSLNPDELEVLLPSGAQTVFYNRIGWARTYLKKAGLLDIPKRGLCKITTAGLKVLDTPPKRIDVKYLEQFEGFIAFRDSHKVEVNSQSKPVVAQQSFLEQTPEESLESAHQTLRLKLLDDLLVEVKLRSPKFFENLVVELIVAMGYGGSRAQAGKAVGKTGDNGIDGIISQDKLGLENIYLQAKRYATGSVGEGDIRDFKGALDAKGAKKGVFITTSYFTEAAKIAADKSLNYKIVLIDGERLAELMIEHNLGVSTAVTYELKKVDTDFFSEE